MIEEIGEILEGNPGLSKTGRGCDCFRWKRGARETVEKTVQIDGKNLQMCACRFLARHMMDVGFRDAETAVFGCEAAGARTVRLDGGVVMRMGAVAEVDGARGGNGVAETLRFGCAVRKLLHPQIF